MNFVRKHNVGIAMTLVMCVALYWWLAPVYGFKAHQGKVPMSPFGWHSLPDAAPYTEQLDDPRYASAAERTKQSLLAHRHRLRSPALSAAVAIDGKLVWAGAAGWSDIASERAATPLTAFRIGSTSKAITATVLARLTERGTVDLDTPIGAYISPLPNDAWHSITLRQLATHQSGLPHYKENTEISGLYRSIALNKHYADVRDALSVFDDSELLFEPGKDFHYSTLGTVLLGATLSHASDVSYRQLVADEILSPLNLNTIAVAPRSAKNRPELATSYFVDGDRFRRWRPVDMTHRLPGGGFVATSSDLAKLGVAWLDNDYLSPATRETFWTPQLMADGEVNAQHYALGFRWSKWQTPDGETYEHANHGGVSRGAQSWLMILPAQRMAVAININRKTEEFGDFAVVYRDILEAFTNP